MCKIYSEFLILLHSVFCMSYSRGLHHRLANTITESDNISYRTVRVIFRPWDQVLRFASIHIVSLGYRIWDLHMNLKVS